MKFLYVLFFTVLVSCGGGSSTTTSEASSTTSEASSTSAVTEIEVAYKVGDTGPGGGIIVYVDEEGFNNSGGDNESVGAMCMTETCHYLEMAPADVAGTFSWSDAINAAGNYSTATADDWVLPTLDALNEVCKYAFGDTVYVTCNDSGDGPFSNSVGGFVSTKTEVTYAIYWSFSEGAYGPLYQGFALRTGGTQGYGSEGATGYVRPVRVF